MASLSPPLPNDIGTMSGSADTFAVPSVNSKEPGLSMLDAQAVQAHVEALLKSTDPDSLASSSNTQSRASSPNSDNMPLTATLAKRNQLSDKEAATKRQRLPMSLEDTSRSPSTEAAAFDASALISQRFQNTFAQYQYPQNLDRVLKVRSNSTDATKTGVSSPSTSIDHSQSVEKDGLDVSEKPASAMTLEEEERAADALLQDIDSIHATDDSETPAPFQGIDLAAAAMAIGLNAETDLLGGTEEDQRALANAIKRLGAEHEEAAQKALQQAADAAAAAAAARASLELANTSSIADDEDKRLSVSSIPPARASHSRSGTSPSKRFACTKCDKAFARAYNLNTHLATHDPDPNRSKPFACPYPSCKSEGGRAFSRKHDLQRHVASIHEKEAEPGIKGDPQEVSGGDTGGLVSLGLGTPGKKFRCETCGRSFVRRDACNRHQCDGLGGSLRGTHSPVGDSPNLRRETPSGQSTVSISRPTPIKVENSNSSYAGTNINGGSATASGLSREVQAAAKQLQARVDAQSPANPTAGHKDERRGFPLTAMSLYANPPISSSNLHSSSGSNTLAGRATFAK